MHHSSRVRLDLFDSSLGLDRGASRIKESVWYLCKVAFFLSSLPWPGSFKCWVLRLFGAQVGVGVVIKPRVNIHFPWKLRLGDHSWIGEESWILNFEFIDVGAHVCISQRAFLCGGNHDYRKPDFRYRNAPIAIDDGAWVGASSFVAPGVKLGTNCVVTAGSVVVSDLPSGMVCRGNPCEAVGPRFKS